MGTRTRIRYGLRASLVLAAATGGCNEEAASTAADAANAEKVLATLLAETFPAGYSASLPAFEGAASSFDATPVAVTADAPLSFSAPAAGGDLCVAFGDPSNGFCIPSDAFENGTVDIELPDDFCERIDAGRVCHDIRCYESATIDGVTFDSTSAQPMLAACGGCMEASCAALLDVGICECASEDDCAAGQTCEDGVCMGGSGGGGFATIVPDAGGSGGDASVGGWVGITQDAGVVDDDVYVGTCGIETCDLDGTEMCCDRAEETFSRWEFRSSECLPRSSQDCTPSSDSETTFQHHCERAADCGDGELCCLMPLDYPGIGGTGSVVARSCMAECGYPYMVSCRTDTDCDDALGADSGYRCESEGPEIGWQTRAHVSLCRPIE